MRLSSTINILCQAKSSYRRLRKLKKPNTFSWSIKGLLEALHVWVTWHPPEADFIMLNSDGAVKARLGLASVGGLFRNHNGDWIIGYVSRIGVTNSLLAELWGLREGLRLARNREFNKIIVEIDSEVVVQVLTRSEKRILPQLRIVSFSWASFEPTRLPTLMGNVTLAQISLRSRVRILSGVRRSWLPPDSLMDLLQWDLSGLPYSRRP